MNLNRIKYSRGQRIVFVVLACFIVGCCLLDWGMRRFYEPREVEAFKVDSALLAEIAEFEKGLDSIEWVRKKEFSPRRVIVIEKREQFDFDPNTIDSADIVRLGFQPYMAHNWLQYRRSGGKIHSIRKLKSIYGIDSVLVDSLKDYISFASVARRADSDSLKYVRKEFFEFEINSADTALLGKLPGIGKGRAAMIVNRRTELGGFYSGEQLREIGNIPDSVIDALIPYIKVELDSLRRIDVNKASIKRLHRHPYISYYQAKAIYDLRWDKKHKGVIEDLDEIRGLKEFAEEGEFERVRWYLKNEE